ncbi:methylmalonyl-CoA mutase family protein [Desulfogranum mediterraneum]|uniref:methylmalonyl-CoA mutase family protein n=1 Tax=Desulfogranum mediterraneum TaxID=160661 RepID=UPI000417D6EF|nr:methylmalonyl-CoA mutase family protein [Desulfogranum mediterraneum]
MSDALDILKVFPAHTHEDWLEAVDKQLKGKPFDKVLVKKTYEGIDIQPMYFQHDLDKLDHVNTLPGQLPYVRGTTASGSKINPWGIAQEITDPDPEEFNQAAVHDLGRGQNTLNVVFDKASCYGLNSEQAPAELVGQGGVCLANLADVETAFKDLDLTTLPVQLRCGYSGVGAMALIGAALHKQEKKTEDLCGCVAADPLGFLASEGSLPVSLDQAYDQMAQLTYWAVAKAPSLQTIGVQVHPYQNSGGNAVQEIAFALATGVAYIRAMQERGLGIDQIAPKITFSFSIGADFFMEIAKFRAARMVWCQVVESFGGSEEARKMRIHARTSSWNKTHVDPWVNMLRVSTEAFSGVAGGVDSMHVSPFDEIFRQPNDFSRRIARNVHIVLKDEGHFNKVIDPAGGCWYVESITAELAEKSWQQFQEIESQGGMFALLQQGAPQKQVAEIAAQRAKNVASRKDRFVGTNMYPNLLEKPEPADELDHHAFQAHRAEQAEHHAATVDRALAEDVLSAMTHLQGECSEAMMDHAIKAVLAGATLGQLSQALGAHQDKQENVPTLHQHRGAEPFEQLRRTTEAFTARTGAAPKLFLANMGPIPQHKARADFSTAFFNVGALETIGNNGFATAEEAAAAALESGARAMVICSTDADYPEVVPPLITAVKAERPDMLIILAGYPKAHIEAFKEAGVDAFLYMGCNALELLATVQQHLGVTA